MEPNMRIDRMLPSLYKAAAEGKPEDYYEALRQAAAEEVGRQVTPNGNTVLHVAVLYGREQFVEKILEREEASPVLLARNHKNETALHCAAAEGHAGIVSVLVSAVNKYGGAGAGEMMVRMTDNVTDTALHKAVRKGHLDVVKLLVGVDTEFEYSANDAGETPIYIAAESQFQDCLEEMLNKCKNLTYGGPLGRNALHAAILACIPDSGRELLPIISMIPTNSEKRHADTIGCSELVFKKEMWLCESKDDYGWTPLHYAVELRDHKTVGMILQEKACAAYICAGKGDKWTTVFHIAARDDNVKMMELISDSCPDCWEMSNSKSQNVFHEAALGDREKVIKYILKSPHVSRLIDEKDKEGNSPLHLLAKSKCAYLLDAIKRNHLVFNKTHQTPFDVDLEHNQSRFYHFVFQQGGKSVWSDSRIGRRGDFVEDPKKKSITGDEEKHIDRMVKSSEKSAILVTLIIGITFAVGFTVPGGYDGNAGPKQGIPILLRNKYFTKFVIAVIINLFPLHSLSLLVGGRSLITFQEVQDYRQYV